MGITNHYVARARNVQDLYLYGTEEDARVWTEWLNRDREAPLYNTTLLDCTDTIDYLEEWDLDDVTIARDEDGDPERHAAFMRMVAACPAVRKK